MDNGYGLKGRLITINHTALLYVEREGYVNHADPLVVLNIDDY